MPTSLFVIRQRVPLVISHLIDRRLVGDPNSFLAIFLTHTLFRREVVILNRFLFKGNTRNVHFFRPPCDVVKKAFLSFTYLPSFLFSFGKQIKKDLCLRRRNGAPDSNAIEAKAAIFCAAGGSILFVQRARARPSPDACLISKKQTNHWSFESVFPFKEIHAMCVFFVRPVM